MAIGGVSSDTCTGVVEDTRRRLVLCAAQYDGRVESGWMRRKKVIAVHVAAEKNFVQATAGNRNGTYFVCVKCVLENIQQSNVALTFGTPGIWNQSARNG